MGERGKRDGEKESESKRRECEGVGKGHRRRCLQVFAFQSVCMREFYVRENISEPPPLPSRLPVAGGSVVEPYKDARAHLSLAAAAVRWRRSSCWLRVLASSRDWCSCCCRFCMRARTSV